MIQDGRLLVNRFVSAGLVLGVPMDAERLLDFAVQPSKYTRHDFEPGHFTASAVLADAHAQRVFLIHHEKLKRWLQPGGHFEISDTSVTAAAVREAEEETGFRLEAASAIPVALSIHRIPAWRTEPAHMHLDLQFLFEAVAGSRSSVAELTGKWFSLGAPEAAGALEHTLDRVKALLRG